MNQHISKHLKESIALAKNVLSENKIHYTIESIVTKMVAQLSEGKSVYWCGNGGSAADVQHLAAELSGRYKLDRRGMPSEALNVNTSFVTSVANDYGYKHVFSRAVEAFCKPHDILIAFSTSGNSANVVKALKTAQNKNVVTIGFTGERTGEMDKFCDFIIKVPSTNTPRIQEMHLLIGHIICEMVETKIYG